MFYMKLLVLETKISFNNAWYKGVKEHIRIVLWNMCVCGPFNIYWRFDDMQLTSYASMSTHMFHGSFRNIEVLKKHCRRTSIRVRIVFSNIVINYFPVLISEICTLHETFLYILVELQNVITLYLDPNFITVNIDIENLIQCTEFYWTISENK